ASLPATALPSIVVMRHLVRDLTADGVFDGADGSGSAIAVTDVRNLHTDALRSHVALAIVDWLESAQNETSLEPGNFTQTGGMLDLMASNTSELFGPEPPQSFDIFGPSLILVQPGDGEAVSGTITVQATASDPSGVELILGYVDYQVSSALGADQDDTAPGFTAALDTTQLADGAHNLRLVAVDTRDNIAIHDFTFIADNSPPEIILEGPAMTGSTAVTVSGTLSDTHSGVTVLEVWAEGAPPDVVNDPGPTFDRMVAIPCNAETQVTARATNGAGLVAVATVTIACDDRDPGFSLLTSTYIPTTRMNVVYDPTNEILLYERLAGQQPVSLNQLDWSSPGPTIEKFFSRLDYIPFGGITIVINNVPYLAILPDDFAQSGTLVGSPAETIQVRYRYSFQGVTKRDWTDLSFSTSDGAFILPLSYQALGIDLADPTGTEEHRIDVRMTDPQGNSAIEEVYFRMLATSPPIVYTDCDLGYLQDRTLTNDLLHEWFSLDNPSFFSGKLVFPRLPQGSLAPWTYELKIPAVQVTFEETGRAQYKTIERFEPCPYYTDDWCTVANDGAGPSPTCWVNQDGKQMHRYMVGAGVGGNASICNDGFWPDGPATSVSVTPNSGTFAGALHNIPSEWPHDPVTDTWQVPTADYLASQWFQPLVFTMRTTVPRPTLSTPDLEGGPMWRSTTKHGGGWGYYMRSHSGYELIRQYSSAMGIDFHWSRDFRADEYIDHMQVTVPAIVPEVTVAELGTVAVLPFDGACGVELINDLTE
ncbi:Ig-like domain-containing protein, partial [Myxococcota bacterium]